MKNLSDIQKAALAVGVVFLLVGLLGFVPGVTTQFDALETAGPGSEAKLLGIFQVSVLHNLVHILFGVLGIAASRAAGQSRQYLTIGGIVYLVLFVYGLIFNGDQSANFVPLNNADNILHLALGVGMLALGKLVGRDGNHNSSGRL